MCLNRFCPRLLFNELYLLPCKCSLTDTCTHIRGQDEYNINLKMHESIIATAKRDNCSIVDSFTAGISLVTLLTVFTIILMMLGKKIMYWIN